MRNIAIMPTTLLVNNNHQNNTGGGEEIPGALTPTTLKAIASILEVEEENSSKQENVFKTPTNTINSNKKPTSYINLSGLFTSGGSVTTITIPKTGEPTTLIPDFVEALADAPKKADIIQPTIELKRETESPESIDQDSSDEDYSPKMKTVTRQRRSVRVQKTSNNMVYQKPTTIDVYEAKGRKGGRKTGPRAKIDTSLDPQEQERIRVRRLRNKEAAARCRQRRLDLISKLSDEVEGWEDQKKRLEDEIQSLRAQKEELEFILQTHQQNCTFINNNNQNQQQKLQNIPVYMAVKSEPHVIVQQQPVEPVITTEAYTVIADVPMSQPAPVVAQVKPQRPTQLGLDMSTSGVKEVHGIPIETPSSILTAFDGFSTGLTPSGPVPSTVASTTSLSLVTPTLNTPSLCRSVAGTLISNDLNADYVSL